jgi:hypothetical protein
MQPDPKKPAFHEAEISECKNAEIFFPISFISFFTRLKLNLFIRSNLQFSEARQGYFAAIVVFEDALKVAVATRTVPSSSKAGGNQAAIGFGSPPHVSVQQITVVKFRVNTGSFIFFKRPHGAAIKSL